MFPAMYDGMLKLVEKTLWNPTVIPRPTTNESAPWFNLKVLVAESYARLTLFVGSNAIECPAARRIAAAPASCWELVVSRIAVENGIPILNTL